VTAKQPAVKKYIVKLDEAERERLNALIQKGKGPARQVLKARILLKADPAYQPIVPLRIDGPSGEARGACGSAA
jgi:hypothetical protein